MNNKKINNYFIALKSISIKCLTSKQDFLKIFKSCCHLSKFHLTNNIKAMSIKHDTK